jgi:hypothetical protein
MFLVASKQIAKKPILRANHRLKAQKVQIRKHFPTLENENNEASTPEGEGTSKFLNIFLP